MSWLARAEIDEVLRSALTARGAPFDAVGESAYVVRLTCSRGLATSVRLVVGDQSLLAESFFVARPSARAEEFYRFLLERNGHMHGVHFAIDGRGDVYLIGRLPLLAVTPAEIDRLLNRLLAYSGETFEAAEKLGFSDFVRAEREFRATDQSQPRQTS